MFPPVALVRSPEVPKLWGAPPPGGAVVPLGGDASCLCEGHIYFERIVGAIQNVHFDRHFTRLKYFPYHSVPVLAPNCKHHILSLTKIEKYVTHLLNFLSDQFI
jgi:hypothetical protein